MTTTNTRRGFLGLLAAGVGWLCGASRRAIGVAPSRRLYRQAIIKFPAGKPLVLPPDAKVIAVSPHVCFMENLEAAKVEHRDLPATPEGHTMPEVRPVYDGGRFIRWEVVG